MQINQSHALSAILDTQRQSASPGRGFEQLFQRAVAAQQAADRLSSLSTPVATQPETCPCSAEPEAATELARESDQLFDLYRQRAQQLADEMRRFDLLALVGTQMPGSTGFGGDSSGLSGFTLSPLGWSEQSLSGLNPSGGVLGNMAGLQVARVLSQLSAQQSAQADFSLSK